MGIQIGKVTHEQVDEVHNMLITMFRNGSINEAYYNKGLVNLASQWLELGEAERAAFMISQLPEHYIRVTLAGQMIEDELFYDIATEVADLLEGTGLLQIDDTEEHAPLPSWTQIGQA